MCYSARLPGAVECRLWPVSNDLAVSAGGLRTVTISVLKKAMVGVDKL